MICTTEIFSYTPDRVELEMPETLGPECQAGKGYPLGAKITRDEVNIGCYYRVPISKLVLALAQRKASNVTSDPEEYKKIFHIHPPFVYSEDYAYSMHKFHINRIKLVQDRMKAGTLTEAKLNKWVENWNKQWKEEGAKWIK